MSEPIQRGGVMEFDVKDLDRYQRIADGAENDDGYDEVSWVSECTSRMLDEFTALDAGVSAWVVAAQEGDSIEGIKTAGWLHVHRHR